MADLSAVLGVAVDVASTSDVEDVVSRHVQGLHARLSAMGDKRIPKPFAVTGQADAAGNAIIAVPAGPAVGMLWDLRILVVMGADDHTAVAGAKGALYAGDPANSAIVDVRDIIGAVPFSENYSGGELSIPFGNQLYVRLYGAPALQIITVTGQVDEYLANAVIANMI